MKNKIVWLILYIGLIIAIYLLIMNYFETEKAIKACKIIQIDYNNVSFNITGIG